MKPGAATVTLSKDLSSGITETICLPMVIGDICKSRLSFKGIDDAKSPCSKFCVRSNIMSTLDVVGSNPSLIALSTEFLSNCLICDLMYTIYIPHYLFTRENNYSGERVLVGYFMK